MSSLATRACNAATDVACPLLQSKTVQTASTMTATSWSIAMIRIAARIWPAQARHVRPWIALLAIKEAAARVTPSMVAALVCPISLKSIAALAAIRVAAPRRATPALAAKSTFPVRLVVLVSQRFLAPILFQCRVPHRLQNNNLSRFIAIFALNLRRSLAFSLHFLQDTPLFTCHRQSPSNSL